MVLKGYPSHAGPRSRRIGLFPPFLTAKPIGMKCRGNLQSGLVTRSRNAFKQECINNLNWKSFSDDWNFKQRLWLCKAAQQGTSWTQMVEPFNKEFKTHRTSEELKTQFEAMRHYFNPATPDSSKPRWARGSRNHKLQSTLFPPSRTSQKWTPEEEDWLCQRRTGKADW